MSDFTRSAYAMHVHDGIVVVEKRPIGPPESRRSGMATLPEAEWTAA